MHKNNFDFLRIAFAIFVVVTHSYILSGTKGCDIICQITNNQTSLSNIGVGGFFIISGFLIFQSLLRSESLLYFYWKRILRLYPALFIVLLLTFILGYLVYDSSIPYLFNRQVLTYLPNNLSLLRTQFAINGIFQTNPFKGTINGSLWTITYEFLFYVLMSFLFWFRKQIVIARTLLISGFVLLYMGSLFFTTNLAEYKYLAVHASNFVDFGLYFAGGAILASFKIENFKNKRLLLIGGLAMLLLSLYLSIFTLVLYLILPVIVITLGLGSGKYINNIGNSIGDLSYGIYIYNFPVQQSLMYFFKLNQLELCLYSLVLTILFSYISWHLIEKRALRLKTYQGTFFWKKQFA